MRLPTRALVITSVAVATTVALVSFFITPLGVPAVSVYIVLLGLLSLLFGGIGSLLSIPTERVGGGCIMAFPVIALFAGTASGDIVLSVCSLLWWTIPITLGTILLLGKRSILSWRWLAGLGFASLALPWYTVYSSNRMVGSSTSAVVTISHLFLPGIIVKGTAVSFLSLDSVETYLGFIPLALVAAGSALYLFKAGKNSDPSVKNQRLVLSGVLLLISTFLTGIAFFFYTLITLIFSGIDHDVVSIQLGFTSAGFWLALTTGVVMIVPVNKDMQKITATMSPSQSS